MRSARRAASATAAPRSAYISAVASPIPEDAPVIATTLPSSTGGTVSELPILQVVLQGQTWGRTHPYDLDAGDRKPSLGGRRCTPTTYGDTQTRQLRLG